VFSGSSAVPVAEVWDTTAQNVITSTEATVRNVLHAHLDAITAQGAWIPPATMLIPIIVALAAGIKSHAGRYVLVFLLGMAVLWLAASVKRALKYRKHGGIDAVIADLRPRPALRQGPLSELNRPRPERPS
jgi:hypothetical protein